ncbi:MAG: hypothetical protein GKR86_00035 [Ilumatobacter sp.]|nr:hypothetical protein [Ilumatobacter sp.]
MNKPTSDVEIPAAAQALSKGKSLQDIAAMMASNTMKMRGLEEPASPNEVIADEDDNDKGEAAPKYKPRSNRRTDEEHAEDLEGGDALDDSDGVGGDDDQSGGGEGDADDAGGAGEEADDAGNEEGDGVADADASDAGEFFELDDDDMIDLGDGTEMSFGDLKNIHNADQFTVEQLQQQETATNEALNMRTSAENEMAQARGVINAMMKHVLDIVAQPMVRKPDEALKTTNADRYIQHLDAYQADQQRIAQTNELLTGAVKEYTEHENQQREVRKQSEMSVLVSKIPAMQSEQSRGQASQDILDAAAFYGYSPEEVNDAIDHRVYRMAYDAQQYRKLVKGQSSETIDLSKEAANKKVRRTRTLRSRGTTAKTRLSTQAKTVDKAKQKAAKSGSAKDVAAFLAAKKTGK